MGAEINRRVIAIVVFIGVVVSIMILDPTLRPSWLEQWITGSQNATNLDDSTSTAGRGSSAQNAVLGLLEPPIVPTVGERTADFALRDLEGNVVQLSQFRGKKNVILNFWATWCAPCVIEMPDLDEIHLEHGSELVVLGVNIQEPRNVVEQFLKNEVSVSYPILFDHDGQVMNGYNVFAQPSTFFVDINGNISPINTFPGKFGAFTSEELRMRVGEFLAAIELTPPSEIRREREILETEFGSNGMLQSKYFSALDFQRFSLEPPARVLYDASLSLPNLSPLLEPDRIPSIDTPRYETAIEASRWLNDEDIVMTIAHNNIIRAYPTRIMNWHEIVNDTFGEIAVSVTFCPLCNSGLVFVRPEIDGVPAEFGTSGRVYKSDLVMYDRQSLTFWSQIEGRPIVGTLMGKISKLEQIPSGMTTWGAWKEAHPTTEVLARPTTDLRLGGYAPISSTANASLFNRDYDIHPYASYVTDNSDTFGTAFTDQRLPAKADVVGIRFDDGASKAFLKEAVKSAKLLNDVVGTHRILVLWDEASRDVSFYRRVVESQPLEFEMVDGQLRDTATQSRWSFSGVAIEGPMSDQSLALEPIAGTTTFWFAWFNFHSQTELFVGP